MVFIFLNSEKEKYKRKNLANMVKAQILFVDGNHENFAMLSKLSKIEMFGSVVGLDEDTGFIHLLRGHEYEIDMKKFFVFGGGHSIDGMLRSKGVSHWIEEIPSIEEIEYAENIIKKNNKYDFVLTHVAPYSILEQMYADEILNLDILYNPFMKIDTTVEKILNRFKEKLNFKKWIFGHYHKDCSFFGKFYGLWDNAYIKIGSEFDTILFQLKTFK